MSAEKLSTFGKLTKYGGWGLKAAEIGNMVFSHINGTDNAGMSRKLDEISARVKKVEVKLDGLITEVSYHNLLSSHGFPITSLEIAWDTYNLDSTDKKNFFLVNMLKSPNFIRN